MQLPGVSTKDNPEIVSSLKKPARLDFRLVYIRPGTPETTPPARRRPGYEPMTLEQEGRNGEIRTERALRQAHPRNDRRGPERRLCDHG